MARAVGNPPQLWKTWAALGRLRSQAGDPDGAGLAYAAAREVIDGVVTRLAHPRLRAAMETAAAIRDIRARAGPVTARG